jgi:hypothetical protein
MQQQEGNQESVMRELLAPRARAHSQKRAKECRMMFESLLLQIIADAEEVGWRGAEVAMAIADAAEDHIMSTAGPRKTKAPDLSGMNAQPAL